MKQGITHPVFFSSITQIKSKINIIYDDDSPFFFK